MADLSDDDRRRFKAWASDDGAWPKAIERDAAGQYKLSITAHSWTVWRAAIAADRALNAPQAAPTDLAAWASSIAQRVLGHDADPVSLTTGARIAIEATRAVPVAPAEPDGYRWRFKDGKDRTWRYVERMPGFDPAVVEMEPLVLAAPHPATAGSGQGAEATQGEPGGPRA